MFIQHRKSERRIRIALQRIQIVQGLEERVPLVPVTHLLGDPILDVGAVQSGDGDVLHVFFHVVPARLEERRDFCVDFVPSDLAPLHRGVVHLVHQHDELGDSEGFGELGVFASLPASLEARLELSLPRGDDQYAHVCLCRSRDHVRHVVLVPRSIQHRVSLLLRFEVCASHLHSLPFGSFLFVGVHDVRHVPRLAVLLLGLLLELLDGPVVYHARLEENLAADGGLAGVHVADEYQVKVLARVVANVVHTVVYPRLLLHSRYRFDTAVVLIIIATVIVADCNFSFGHLHLHLCNLFYHCFHRGSCRWSRWWCSNGDGSSLGGGCWASNGKRYCLRRRSRRGSTLEKNGGSSPSSACTRTADSDHRSLPRWWGRAWAADGFRHRPGRGA
mmetsp:Transcript_33067/g.83384  ORF Transcript_33067/g.83384 Transcript_33067/m.83384 type:complete len:389 (-) Transcript_33067:472-1638(-)